MLCEGKKMPRRRQIPTCNDNMIETRLNYWESSPQLIDLRFYTAFTILATAILNYISGKTYSSDYIPSHWGSTAYYYSMVFSIRLLLFITVGDYPTQHRDLIQGLRSEATYDWLPLFSSHSTSYQNRIVKCKISFNNLVEKLQVYTNFPSSSGLKQKLTQMQHVLAISKKIRVDESYQSLIIMNHFDHSRVSTPVTQLSLDLADHSKDFLDFATECFSNFIERKNSGVRRNAVLSYLNWKSRYKGFFYLQATSKALDLNQEAFEEVWNLLENNNLIRLSDINLANAFYKNIIVDQIEIRPKATIMDTFEKNALKLHILRLCKTKDNLTELDLQKTLRYRDNPIPTYVLKEVLNDLESMNMIVIEQGSIRLG